MNEIEYWQDGEDWIAISDEIGQRVAAPTKVGALDGIVGRIEESENK